MTDSGQTNAKDIGGEIEGWFHEHFGNFQPGTEIHAALEKAHRNIRVRFGLPPVAAPVEKPTEDAQNEPAVAATEPAKQEDAAS